MPSAYRHEYRHEYREVKSLVATWKEKLVLNKKYIYGICVLLAIGLVYGLGLTPGSRNQQNCIEGAVILHAEQPMNCKSSEATIHIKEGERGVYAWCSCPNSVHGQNLP